MGWGREDQPLLLSVSLSLSSVLGFELRVSGLLNRHTTTWATPPAQISISWHEMLMAPARALVLVSWVRTFSLHPLAGGSLSSSWFSPLSLQCSTSHRSLPGPPQFLLPSKPAWQEQPRVNTVSQTSGKSWALGAQDATVTPSPICPGSLALDNSLMFLGANLFIQILGAYCASSRGEWDMALLPKSPQVCGREGKRNRQDRSAWY
jgi:hypothetical protein